MTILLTITDLALTTTPLIILVVMMMMMMMMMRMMRVQKVASNWLKIEYVVVWGICQHILVQQIFVKKSYGFRAI